MKPLSKYLENTARSTSTELRINTELVAFCLYSQICGCNCSIMSRMCGPEPKNNNVTLVNRIRENLPVFNSCVNNFVFENAAVELVIDVLCST